MSKVQVFKCDGRVPCVTSHDTTQCGRLMEAGEGVEVHGSVHIIGRGGVIGDGQPDTITHLCPRCFKMAFKDTPGLEWVGTRGGL